MNDMKETTEDGSAAEAPKVPELTELDKAQKMAKEYLEGWQRAKADYSNLKKESAKREDETVKFATAALIIELIPIYDHLKLALQHMPAEDKSHSWVKGVEMIRGEFKAFLERLGIEEIETVGKEFNPEVHMAVAKEKKDGQAEHMVFEEVSPGYTFHGKTLQPAKVKVAE